MNRKTFLAGAAALFLGAGGAAAAPIDLEALGFQEDSPSYTGSGGVFYDFGSQTLSDDFLFPIRLDDFADSLVAFFFDPFDPNTADVYYEDDGFSGDFELFDIVESGDNESDTLEFLLSLFDSDLANGTAGVGPDALLRVTSSDFDFSASDPFDFFDDNSENSGFGLEYLADVTITLTALERTAAVVPLPSSLPLVLAGLGAFAMVRRKSRTK